MNSDNTSTTNLELTENNDRSANACKSQSTERDHEHANAKNSCTNARKSIGTIQLTNSADVAANKVDVAIQTEEIATNCSNTENICFHQCMINNMVANSCCGGRTVNNRVLPDVVIERWQRLKRLFNERARTVSAVTSENYPLNGRSINFVPVEIGHEVFCKSVNKTSDTTSGFDQTSTQDQVPYTSFFSEAAKLAEDQTKEWNDTQAKEAHKKIHSNIVGIVGPPGIGKTTLTKYIIKKTIEKEMYTNVDIVFYIQFRDINFEERHSNLLKFLLASSYIDWEYDLDTDREILKLLDSRFHVMIVLDGLNESAIPELSEFTPAVTLLAKAKAENFIKGILGGKLLPRSKKILTSRPRQIYELHHDHRPRMILNVLGISNSSQQKICKDLCGDAHERVFECIAKNPRISPICNNPLYCILVMLCIEQQLQQSGVVDVIGSVTGIFASVLEMFICSDHTSCDFNCEKLPELAWQCMISNQQHFSEVHLEKTGIDQKNLNNFFNHQRVESNPRRRITSAEKTSSFNHSMLIEFLAAVKLVQSTDTETFRTNLEYLKKIRFESVTKFLFGLFNRNYFPCLSKIGISTEFFDDDAKIRIAKDFALKTLENAMAKKVRSSIEIMWKVCSCAYEMHDDSFAREIAEMLGGKLSIVNHVHPGDIAGFCYVLQAKRSDQFELCLDPCIRFLENSFRQFFEKMFGVMESTKIVMRVVDVSRNKVGDDEIIALSKCLPRITSLSLSDCEISTSQVKIITEAVLNLKTPIHEIYFAYNTMDDQAARYIARCIHEVDQLHLSLCSFSESGVKVLAEAIEARPTSMKHFCFSGNITSKKLSLMSTCIGNLDELLIGLQQEKINVVPGLEELCNSIRKRSKPLESLIIRGSNFGDEGFLALSNCICNINNLKLGNTYDGSLTSFGIRELVAAFSKLESPMQSFIFGCPDRYLDEAVVEFSYCDKNIKSFSIR